MILSLFTIQLLIIFIINITSDLTALSLISVNLKLKYK